jgi:proteasome lid subunit RPN8/RPN11
LIEITTAQHLEMLAHAEADFPNECCGLLFGRGTRAEQLRRMENVEHSPLNYRVDPKVLLAVFDEMDQRELELLGIYHSHTHSPAYPSKTDRDLAGYPEAHYLIVSLQHREQPTIRAFRIVQGQVSEEPIEIRHRAAAGPDRSAGEQEVELR